ncbi:MAG: nuclease [Gammaproteobacteria bacterium]|nr:nuclease [Gammaproteobacteria bacterium]
MQPTLLLKALIAGRLFYWLLFLFPLTAQAAPLCPPNHIDEQVKVRYVHDGDTLILSNGEKVRLIGINTPELARKGRPNQPLAIQARDRLRQLVASSNNQLSLKLDAEKRDRYGRLLAHLYSPDGNSLSAQLLEDGLATLLAVPPNLDGLGCYSRIEKQARHARKPIWQLDRFQIIRSRNLHRNSRGYHRISGKVVRIGEGRRNLWLNLPGNVAFRIEKKELPLFKTLKPRELVGKTILASGFLYQHKGALRMRLRTPYALEVLD